MEEASLRAAPLLAVHAWAAPWAVGQDRTRYGRAAEVRRSRLAQARSETLRAAGLAKRRHPVKVLGRGELTKKLTVRAHGFSATAREKIESAGGTADLIDS